jgi:hypothetical protein
MIFTLLQNQFPMPFRDLCDKIGLRSEFRDDANRFIKVALSPDIFWLDTFVDDISPKSEYISLKIWEEAFGIYQKRDCCNSSKDREKTGREGTSWKRAFEAVSKLHPAASVLLKCAIIADMFPALCDRHQTSSVLAANCLHEIAKAIDTASFCPDPHVTMDPEAIKIVRWGDVSRDIMEKAARRNMVSRQSSKREAFSAPEPESSATSIVHDFIMVSDDEPSPQIIDLDSDNSDDDGCCEILLHRKRPFDQSQDVQGHSCDTDLCHKLGPDDRMIFKFAVLLCLKGLQSNLTFQLSTVRDKILQLCPQRKNTMAVVELAALALQERHILMYNSSSLDKECDPSPCFQLNIDKGLVISVSNSAPAHVQFKQIANPEETLVRPKKTNPRVQDFKFSKLRSEFSFVAPPECQSFQDQKVFLRSAADSNEVSTASVTKFTSMYSHFTNVETAISFLTSMEEDERNHACSTDSHPIIQLIEGRFEIPEPEVREDENDLDFEEPKSIVQDDDANPEAFKPYCQRPDPNIQDFRKKIEIFLKLDFEVAYSIEHYISSGGLLWNSLDYSDLEKLERCSIELLVARKSPVRDVYMQVLNRIKVQLCSKENSAEPRCCF